MAKPKSAIIAKALWVVNNLLPASGSCKVKTNDRNLVVTGPAEDIGKLWKKLVNHLREYEPVLNDQVKIDSRIESPETKAESKLVVAEV